MRNTENLFHSLRIFVYMFEIFHLKGKDFKNSWHLVSLQLNLSAPPSPQPSLFKEEAERYQAAASAAVSQKRKPPAQVPRSRPLRYGRGTRPVWAPVWFTWPSSLPTFRVPASLPVQPMLPRANVDAHSVSAEAVRVSSLPRAARARGPRQGPAH